MCSSVGIVSLNTEPSRYRNSPKLLAAITNCLTSKKVSRLTIEDNPVSHNSVLMSMQAAREVISISLNRAAAQDDYLASSIRPMKEALYGGCSANHSRRTQKANGRRGRFHHN